MTIDKAKLKELAERAVASNPPGGDGNPFPALAVRAVDVLALLAEIERLGSEAMYEAAGAQSDREQIDQLKAENEALRKQVADDERKLDALLAHCDDGECPTCAQIICPHGGAMHFHHDGCPTCAAHEEAMAKEASHG